MWPSGEKVRLEFRVSGDDIDEHLEGETLIDPQDRPRERYALRFARFLPEGAVYAAQLPARTDDFVYHAYLGDGRKNRAGNVRFLPRPVVTEIAAWVRLPVSCGLKPLREGKAEEIASRRYEVPQIGAT